MATFRKFLRLKGDTDSQHIVCFVSFPVARGKVV